MYDVTHAKPTGIEPTALPLATYCAGCQTLMLPNTPVIKEDGCTFWHATKCPTTPMRHMAPHKHPNTEMDMTPK